MTQNHDQQQHQDLLRRINEFQTPLVAVQQILTLIQGSYSIDDIKTLINDIFLSNRRLLISMENLLESSRYEENKEKNKNKTLLLTSENLQNLAELVRETCQELIPEAHRKGLQVKQDIADIYVSGDRVNLKRAVWNLLDNAIKFTQVGEIEVCCYQREDKAAIFKVRDTGCGIAPKNHQIIFNRYRQAHHLQPVGAGLGLYLARLIAQEHGGAVALVESQLGKGSTFELVLPAAS